MALAAPKAFKQYDGPDFLRKVPVKASAIIYHGALVVKTASDYAKPATAAGSLIVLGIADLEAWSDKQGISGQQTTVLDTSYEKIDNTGGADKARHLAVRQGAFVFKNKAGDLVDESMIGEAVYIEDDETVRATATGTTAAGKLVGFDDDGLPIVTVGIGASYGESV
jgi:hypothetical protein